ncbi:hypothetical protein P7C70_g7252, partial [Phenoliferia sp. Uapishka_3]
MSLTLKGYAVLDPYQRDQIYPASAPAPATSPLELTARPRATHVLPSPSPGAYSLDPNKMSRKVNANACMGPYSDRPIEFAHAGPLRLSPSPERTSGLGSDNNNNMMSVQSTSSSNSSNSSSDIRDAPGEHRAWSLVSVRLTRTYHVFGAPVQSTSRLNPRRRHLKAQRESQNVAQRELESLGAWRSSLLELFAPVADSTVSCPTVQTRWSRTLTGATRRTARRVKVPPRFSLSSRESQANTVWTPADVTTSRTDPAPPRIEGRSDTCDEVHRSSKQLTLAFKFECSFYLRAPACMLGIDLLTLVAAHVEIDPSNIYVHAVAPLRLEVSLEDQGILDGALHFVGMRMLGGGTKEPAKDRTPADWARTVNANIKRQEEKHGLTHPGTICIANGCQLPTDYFRHPSWSSKCSRCSWKSRNEVVEEEVLEKRKAAKTLQNERAKKKRRGEAVESLRVSKTPHTNRGPLYKRSQRDQGADLVDFDGDASDSDDDYDEHGKYNRPAVPEVSQSPSLQRVATDKGLFQKKDKDEEEDSREAAIQLPDFVPNTDTPVPDDATVITFGSSKAEDSCMSSIPSWVNRRSAESAEQLGSVETLKIWSARISPVIGVQSFLIRVGTQYPDVKDLRAAQNKSNHKSPYRQLLVMADGIIARNRTYEVKYKIKAADRLDAALKKVEKRGRPAEIIGAAILHLAEHGGSISGDQLVKFSFNYLNTEKLAIALDKLQHAKCPVTGMALDLLTFDRYSNKPSIDRQTSSMTYFESGQQLWLISLGSNFMFGDFESTDREDLLRIIESPDVELAQLVVQITDFLWSEAKEDEDEDDPEYKEDKEHRALARAMGWNPDRARAKLPDISSILDSQGSRKYVEGRPGIKRAAPRGGEGDFVLDRRAWDAGVRDINYDDRNAARDATRAHKAIYTEFYVSHGMVCAVTGYCADGTFELECDRLTDDQLYSTSTTWMVLAPINKFKSTLSMFRTMRALLSHIQGNPRLLVMYEEEGLKATAAHIIRCRLKDDEY